MRKKPKQIQKNKNTIQINSQLQYQNENQHQQFLSNLKIDEEKKKILVNKLGSNSYQKTDIYFFNSLMNSLHLMYLLNQSTKQKLINPSIIKKLYLDWNKIGDDGIKQLCRKKYNWIALKQLKLSGNIITIKGIQYLCNSAQIKLFPQLSSLYLDNNNIGQIENIEELKQEGLLFKLSNNNTKLKQLYLFKNNITDKCMLRLFKLKDGLNINNDQKIFHYLQSLFLSQNDIFICIIKRPNKQLLQQYPQLRRLCLSHNKINKIGLKFLFQSFNSKITHNIKQNSLSKLQQLALDNNNLYSQTIRILVSNKNMFYNLQKLWINDNPLIGDQGIIYFIKAFQEGAFSKLQFLEVSNVNISDNGIQSIIKSYYPPKNLTKIKQLHLNNNKKISINPQMLKKKILKRFNPKMKLLLG